MLALTSRSINIAARQEMDYLNKNAFINYHDFNTDHDFVERIIEVDRDDILYKKIATQPIVENLSCLRLAELEQHLLKIINL